MAEMDDVKIKKIEYPDANGGINLIAESPAFAILAQECVKLFKGQGAINYCEWKMNSGDPAFGIFNVIIQREAGETPAQQNSRLKKELKEKELQNLELLQSIEIRERNAGELTFQLRDANRLYADLRLHAQRAAGQLREVLKLGMFTPASAAHVRAAYESIEFADKPKGTCAHRWGRWIKSSDRDGHEFKRCEDCTILEYRPLEHKPKHEWVDPTDVDPMERTMPVTEKRPESSPKIAHCYGTYCHYLNGRKCMCLCATCAAAVKADH